VAYIQCTRAFAFPYAFHPSRLFCDTVVFKYRWTLWATCHDVVWMRPQRICTTEINHYKHPKNIRVSSSMDSLTLENTRMRACIFTSVILYVGYTHEYLLCSSMNRSLKGSQGYEFGFLRNFRRRRQRQTALRIPWLTGMNAR
jgi:hypothetical protein